MTYPNTHATQMKNATYVGSGVGAAVVGVAVGCAEGDPVIGRTVMSESVLNKVLRFAYPPVVVYLGYDP